MVRRSGRSRSRGRPDKYEAVNYEKKSPQTKTPKAKKGAKAEEPVEKKKMEFAVDDAVMARWPGSSLFFKAKVTFVREDDEEYDVEYENGTVYTIRAKDVYKADAKVLKKATGTRRSKSRGRGRSAGRKKKEVETPVKAALEESADEAEGDKTEKTETDAPKPKAVPKTPKVAKPAAAVATPTRQSARIAAKATSDAFSDDETEKVKLAPNPELPDARGKKKGWSFEWVWCLFFMLLGPLVLISLHTLCTKTGCKLEVPKLSKNIKDYFNLDSFYLVLASGTVIPFLGFLPVGKVANGQRMNGFVAMALCLLAIPVLVYAKVPLNIVRDNYFQIMSTCIAFSFFDSLLYYAMSFRASVSKGQLNSKGNTGNPIVDIFNGRTTTAKFMGLDCKLTSFRFSMISLALLNVVMVTDSIVSSGGKLNNPAAVLGAAFQVVYALDAIFFEEYYFYSHDALNTGLGFSLISTYLTFPFLPTLITKYLLDRSPVVLWYYLVLIGLMNAVGYVIFRSSETQRCEFAKDPANPALAHLETVTTAGNKKLIVSGWWALVRHPNYLGEILIQWSWVLPAVGSLGLTDLVPYYLPFITTLMLLVRCHQLNQRNKRKYGAAWNSYCEKTKSNIIPMVY